LDRARRRALEGSESRMLSLQLTSTSPSYSVTSKQTRCDNLLCVPRLQAQHEVSTISREALGSRFPYSHRCPVYIVNSVTE